MLEFFVQLDQQLFLILNGIHNQVMDQVMFTITNKFTWVPFYVVLLGIVGYYLRWRALMILVFVVVLITLSDQFSVLCKNTFERPRPCHEPALSGLVHTFGGRCGGKFGFVSSHAANTFALAVFMGGLLRSHIRWMLPLLLVWASVISYSRVYLGVHYPADIIGGAAMGIAIGYFVLFLWKKWEKYTRKPERVLPR
jgi:undecaprenyl-diphosphatase